MYEYLKGKIMSIKADHVVLEVNAIGYFLHTSVNTYEQIKDKQDTLLYTHLVVKEDDMQLYGFSAENERKMFRYLISVNGVGVATARLLLSSLTVQEAAKAIMEDKANVLKSVKGIGPKAAQKIIIELQDKISKEFDLSVADSEGQSIVGSDALDALIALGIPKLNAQKAIKAVYQQKDVNLSTEEIIKLSLKML